MEYLPKASNSLNILIHSIIDILWSYYSFEIPIYVKAMLLIKLIKNLSLYICLIIFFFIKVM